MQSGEMSDIFKRLRDLELDTTEDRTMMRTHIDSCLIGNEAAARFRKELRGYFVMIVCALIGLIAAAKFHLV